SQFTPERCTSCVTGPTWFEMQGRGAVWHERRLRPDEVPAYMVRKWSCNRGWRWLPWPHARHERDSGRSAVLLVVAARSATLAATHRCNGASCAGLALLRRG